MCGTVMLDKLHRIWFIYQLLTAVRSNKLYRIWYYHLLIFFPLYYDFLQIKFKKIILKIWKSSISIHMMKSYVILSWQNNLLLESSITSVCMFIYQVQEKSMSHIFENLIIEYKPEKCSLFTWFQFFLGRRNHTSIRI